MEKWRRKVEKRWREGEGKVEGNWSMWRGSGGEGGRSEEKVGRKWRCGRKVGRKVEVKGDGGEFKGKWKGSGREAEGRWRESGFAGKVMR